MNKNKIALALLIPTLAFSLLLIMGCSTQAVPVNQTPTTPTATPTTSPQTQNPTKITVKTPPKISGITMTEVAKHNSESDCWMAINGKVYNVTSYITSHPGGGAILLGCSKDATSLFEGRHSQNAHNILQNYYLDNLK